MTDSELLELLVRALSRSNGLTLVGLQKSVALLDEQLPALTRIAKVLGTNMTQFMRVPQRGTASLWRLSPRGLSSTRESHPYSRAKSRTDSFVAEPLANRPRVVDTVVDSPTSVTAPSEPIATPRSVRPTKSLHGSRKPHATISSPQPQVLSQLLPTMLAKLSLRPWQQSALAAWQEAGRQGIVEAVTGAGKTRLAIAAAAETLLDPASRVLVLVPTLALASQWESAFRSAASTLPLIAGAKIHMRNGNDNPATGDARIQIATMQFAYTRLMLKRPGPSLLIGDEVHRLGAPAWSASLDDAFQRRLGLTATLERDDEGVESILLPYFKRVVFQLDLPAALKQQIVSEFRVVFVAVSFTACEQAAFDAATSLLRSTRSTLRASGIVAMEPFGVFMRDVQLHSNNPASKLCKSARAFLTAFAERRELVASAENKFRRVSELAPVLQSEGRALMFCETVQSMQRASEVLARAGVTADCLDGSTPLDVRNSRLDRLRKGTVQVLLAPKILDEGIDVPDAGTGVIVAASSSRRQMIQRLGRVIRLKPDRHDATIFVLFVEGTQEDPNMNDRMETLSLLLDNARNVQRVGPRETIDLSALR